MHADGVLLNSPRIDANVNLALTAELKALAKLVTAP